MKCHFCDDPKAIYTILEKDETLTCCKTCLDQKRKFYREKGKEAPFSIRCVWKEA